MGSRKKETKVCDTDRISQLPDPLISEILCHLSTKDAVRTSVLSTRWRNLWQSVPELDLNSYVFSDVNCFVSFAESFFHPHMESWIRKLELNMSKSPDDKSFLNRWIDAVSRRQIICPNEAILEKLISGPPLLEDLTLIRSLANIAKVLQVRSQTLKRIVIDEPFAKVVIDAPLLQFLRTCIYTTKNFEIINLGFSTKLDFGVAYAHATYSTSLIHGILTDISRVRDLVISLDFWKDIFLYSKSGPVLQFYNLSHLKTEFSKSDLEMLPTLLESCPKLESLILEMVKDPSMRGKKKRRTKGDISSSA
ncbi:F-box/FBD/LRR-repeat protein [Cardamine amara subsp. amara]|uniref:F-box/FBD/LRR-repeat protein n=1 Tax=Cardamine amara subsp. amara TaxID=228776 RepID=A0ABD1AJ25_CARAN